MRTTTERPFRKLVTRMRVLNGRLREAAASSSGRKVSPLAVRSNALPAYHEATPIRSLWRSRQTVDRTIRGWTRCARFAGAGEGSVAAPEVRVAATAGGACAVPPIAAISEQANTQRAILQFRVGNRCPPPAH